MPPHIIPEAQKRRLERQYAPLQALNSHQSRIHSNNSTPLRQISEVSEDLQTPTMEHRNLPSREVTDETFDDTYVNFIMYCNPAIALDTDTTELRKTFRAPPRSDGKAFSTFKLFELITKLEQKEIKTWAQLAIDLGVEPPDFDKRQSAQKVYIYSGSSIFFLMAQC